MSAFGTKKPNGDRGLQLTFPLNFQEAYTGGYSYYPSSLGPPLDIMVGTDFQSDYHEQKRLDANQSVLNGIQAKKTMERKLLTGHQNYHLPKPVLSQRRFANPMNGVTGFSSARRDNDYGAPFQVVEGGMRGGVVTTAEGQEFYALQLQRRVDQLNQMNALAQGFPVPAGQTYESYRNQDFGTRDKISFFTSLRSLSDSILEGDLTRFSFENVKEMLNLLFKFAPTASLEDFQDTRDALDESLVSVRSLQSEDPELREGFNLPEYAETLKILLNKAREYVIEMEVNINRSQRDKNTLSKSLIKSLGFTSFLRKKREFDVVEEEARVNTRVRQAAENFDGRNGGDGDDDGAGDGRFNRPAQTREDDELGGRETRQPFSGDNGDPNRALFGNRNGQFTNGPAAFFGEEQPELVAPLDLSGFDAAAQIPEQNVNILSKAVEDELKRQLASLGYTENQDMEEFINKNYPEANQLATDIEKALLEKQFTKAQIARGMEELGLPSFSQYIAENTGAISAAPIPVVPRRIPASLPEVGVGGETSQDILRRANLPLNRNELYSQYGKYEDLKKLPSRIPREYGGPYKPKEGTKRKSILSTLLQYLKKIDPNY